MIFTEQNLVDYSLLLRQNATLPNFAEKTFVNNHKTAKIAKLFSLESFPLYGTSWIGGGSKVVWQWLTVFVERQIAS